MKELELEGKNVPVIRILPNTACLIGKGFILIEQGDSYTKEQEDEFRYILREAGGFDSLPASQFVAGTVLTSTSPAFIAMFANSLADRRRLQWSFTLSGEKICTGRNPWNRAAVFTERKAS